jgi:hypothetical protein
MQPERACAPTHGGLLSQKGTEIKKYDPDLVVTLAEEFGSEITDSLSAYTVVSWYRGVLLGMEGADPQLRGKQHRGAIARTIVLLKLGPVSPEWDDAFGVLDAQRLWLLSWFTLVSITPDRVWPMLQPSFSQMTSAFKDGVVPSGDGWDARKWGRIKNAGELVYETVYNQWADAETAATSEGTEAARDTAYGMLLVLHLVVNYVGVPTADPLWKDWPADPPPKLVTPA